VRSGRRWGSSDHGFALSDHADWSGLLRSIRATGAEHIHVTHGFQKALSRYLREQGWQASEVHSSFRAEEEDDRSDTGREAGEDD
jgi:putative mRNA 3-end processing factor